MGYRSLCMLWISSVLFATTACVQGDGKADIGQIAATKSPDQRVENLREAAEAMNSAMLNRDAERFVDFTLPQLAESAGGRSKLVEVLKESFTKTFDAFSTVTLETLEPEALVEIDKKLFGVVPFRIEGVIEENNNSVISQASMVGVSSDNGFTWKFASDATFFEFFPEAVGKITIPKARISVNGVEQ